MARRFVVCAALLALWPGAAGADGERVGWHGETMPEGLERAVEPGEYLYARDGAIMVYVPAGSFTMGSATGDSDERPVRHVHLDAYYIDQHEVSWARYKSSGLKWDERRELRLPHPFAPDWGIFDDQPMINLNWHDARAYAQWAGKRLPTEAEWEKAARGTDGRTYPWGSEEPSFDRAIWKDHPIAEEMMAPVDCCEAGASPYGALNMAGNAYEWCEDVYAADFYSRAPSDNPVNTEAGRYRVLRGGAFVLEPDTLRSALRYRLYPTDRADYIGFRTVLPVTPASEPAAADTGGGS